MNRALRETFDPRGWPICNALGMEGSDFIAQCQCKIIKQENR